MKIRNNKPIKKSKGGVDQSTHYSVIVYDSIPHQKLISRLTIANKQRL